MLGQRDLGPSGYDPNRHGTITEKLAAWFLNNCDVGFSVMQVDPGPNGYLTPLCRTVSTGPDVERHQLTVRDQHV